MPRSTLRRHTRMWYSERASCFCDRPQVWCNHLGCVRYEFEGVQLEKKVRSKTITYYGSVNIANPKYSASSTYRRWRRGAWLGRTPGHNFACHELQGLWNNNRKLYQCIPNGTQARWVAGGIPKAVIHPSSLAQEYGGSLPVRSHEVRGSNNLYDNHRFLSFSSLSITGERCGGFVTTYAWIYSDRTCVCKTRASLLRRSDRSTLAVTDCDSLASQSQSQSSSHFLNMVSPSSKFSDLFMFMSYLIQTYTDTWNCRGHRRLLLAPTSQGFDTRPRRGG